ncbi:hypothetical protein NDU88_002735 [Pleurodeles waltl]|uniref:Uncharacterized protein n=1 Tax=Pleurodeles waltl TaxID=8319 RepID=A0AAV7W2Q1_PLEWA|nr:hypothetical protein NDU88_002735 [Pleurodeles waltl]
MEFRPWRKPPTETATSTLRPPWRYKQTARRSPSTDRQETMYRPPYHNPPIRHLFRGGSLADKNTAFRTENAHLHTPHEESGQHGTRTPHPPSYCLPAPLPGARTPAQKTTVCGSGHGMEVIRHLTCGWRGLPAHLSDGLRGPPGLQYRACGCPPAHLGCGLRGPPGLQYRASGCPPAHLGWGWWGLPVQLAC